MEAIRRPAELRPDPFVPDTDFVHSEIDELYDAIYNVRLHHHDGRKDPRKSFNKACDVAILMLEAMKVQKSS